MYSCRMKGGRLRRRDRGDVRRSVRQRERMRAHDLTECRRVVEHLRDRHLQDRRRRIGQGDRGDVRIVQPIRADARQTRQDVGRRIEDANCSRNIEGALIGKEVRNRNVKEDRAARHDRGRALVDRDIVQDRYALRRGCVERQRAVVENQLQVLSGQHRGRSARTSPDGRHIDGDDIRARRLDVHVDRAVAGHRECQVRAVAGHRLQVGAHRQQIDVCDVVLCRAEGDGEGLRGGFSINDISSVVRKEDAVGVVGVPAAGVLDDLSGGAIDDVQRHRAEVRLGCARRDRRGDDVAAGRLAEFRGLLGGDARREILGGHKFVARVVGVGDKILVQCLVITGRRRSRTIRRPVRNAIVMPRPDDDRRFGIRGQLIEQGLPVTESGLRGLSFELDFGEVEGDVRRDIDRLGVLTG